MNNKCDVCGSEMMIDRMDDNGQVFYVCMNKICPKYRQSFNPVSGDISESEIQEAQTGASQ